jgi:hypothetical protein
MKRLTETRGLFIREVVVLAFGTELSEDELKLLLLMMLESELLLAKEFVVFFIVIFLLFDG